MPYIGGLTAAHALRAAAPHLKAVQEWSQKWTFGARFC